MKTEGFKTFEDLEVWQEARKFRKRIYDLAKRLPAEEKFGAAAQMRRAALSVTNNIAEGHGRYHFQENIQYLRQSRGSIEELRDDLTLCEDEQYAPVEELRELNEQAITVRKMLNGYIRHLREQKQTYASVAKESSAEYEIENEDDDV